MAAVTPNGFHEFRPAARPFVLGLVSFVGLFAALIFLLRNLMTWVLNVLNVSH
jgi:hypothetical protein